MLSVSLRTAQLWSETGVLEAWKTEGGHRRISRLSIDHLLANSSVNHTGEVKKSVAPALLKVLVVEDDPTLRRLYEAKIRRWPIQLVLNVAQDGYEALIRIGGSKPDLLITDLHMPGMDGFLMLQTLCGMPELLDMKIIVVSGLDPAEINARGGVPDGVGILPKPIPFDQLLEMAAAMSQQLNSTVGENA